MAASVHHRFPGVGDRCRGGRGRRASGSGGGAGNAGRDGMASHRGAAASADRGTVRGGSGAGRDRARGGVPLGPGCLRTGEPVRPVRTRVVRWLSRREASPLALPGNGSGCPTNVWSCGTTSRARAARRTRSWMNGRSRRRSARRRSKRCGSGPRRTRSTGSDGPAQVRVPGVGNGCPGAGIAERPGAGPAPVSRTGRGRSSCGWPRPGLPGVRRSSG